MAAPQFQINTDGCSEEGKQALLEAITIVEDFPKPGLRFKELTNVLTNYIAFQAVVDAFAKRYRAMGVTAVVGIESRGYAYASPVALALGVPFVPFRKPGKMPCKSVGVDFNLGGWNKSASFGKDRLECREDGLKPGAKVLIIDDLLGTGATLIGACALVEHVKAEVVECACVVDMPALNGRTNVPKPTFILVDDLSTEGAASS
mmetsp:Transcript_23245/g.46653  ORF Transcript_23245/g.46653 Transcript_23245/m.46653 type:complete len:204 (-) Transcript_23245:202-813(-)|eukprot:CAMPEP_0196740320 /NCGR_PEP_ID=MMETSP1091-20130531/31265_1 /TAXON_ID=302021 /ORGANISM="Rhodomonas sp., Strain CCMP768" /LENGTH=203 /DNA_ID=CAMNT_0042085417 /DNA_START=101 /DNA_END=712 /DNA_ORIENTATION=-